MNYFRGGWRLSSCGALSAQRTGLGSCPGDPPRRLWQSWLWGDQDVVGGSFPASPHTARLS